VERRVKILVVEDSEIMRKLIVRCIGLAGGQNVEVLEATDGMQALATIARHGPSIELILCDMYMPNLDGLSLLRSLRGSPEFRHTMFVIVTGDEWGERTAQAMREGAAGVIGKPFRPEVIAALVRRRRSHGRRATSGVFRTDTITKMVDVISGSGRSPDACHLPVGAPGRPAGPKPPGAELSGSAADGRAETGEGCLGPSTGIGRI
jgi:two-component system chemotaxis response regulator CheY